MGLNTVQKVQHRVIKMIEYLPYEERLRQLGVFNMEKRTLMGDLICVCTDVKGSVWRLEPGSAK